MVRAKFQIYFFNYYPNAKQQFFFLNPDPEMALQKKIADSDVRATDILKLCDIQNLIQLCPYIGIMHYTS